MSVFAKQFLAVFLLVLLAACAGKTVPDNLTGGPGGQGTNNVKPGTSEDFTVNVGDRVFFLVDQSTLTPEARATLDKQAAWLRQFSTYNILIEGHSDERGTRAYNIGLGARRASAVRNYLASLGVPATRLRTTSFGKERPVVSCNNATCWNRNRRSVTVLTN